MLPFVVTKAPDQVWAPSSSRGPKQCDVLRAHAGTWSKAEDGASPASGVDRGVAAYLDNAPGFDERDRQRLAGALPRGERTAFPRR